MSLWQSMSMSMSLWPVAAKSAIALTVCFLSYWYCIHGRGYSFGDSSSCYTYGTAMPFTVVQSAGGAFFWGHRISLSYWYFGVAVRSVYVFVDSVGDSHVQRSSQRHWHWLNLPAPLVSHWSHIIGSYCSCHCHCRKSMFELWIIDWGIGYRFR